MDVTPLVLKGQQLIEAYGSGGFRVTGVAHNGSVIVFPDAIFDWSVASLDMISTESLQPIFARQGEDRPEIVLLGCGEHFLPVPRALRELFRSHFISLEAMDTGAACRTYNILMTEGRRVAAALIAV